MPEDQRHRRGGQRAEHRQQHDQDDRQVPLLGLGDVVLGGLRGGGAQRALTDDVQLDLAVRRSRRVDRRRSPTFCRSCLATSTAPVLLKSSLQRHHVGPVGLRRRLLRVGHHLDAGHLGGDALQLRDRGVHVVEGGVGARRGHQRQRRGALVGEVVLELVLHVQRLRTGDLETATGEMAGLVQRRARRRARGAAATPRTPPSGYLRRLLLKRIMNCWMVNSPLSPRRCVARAYRSMRWCDREPAVTP